MFYKRWLFSSLESRELANFINMIGSEFDSFYVDINPTDLANPNPADIINKAQKEITSEAQKEIINHAGDKLIVGLRGQNEPLWANPAMLDDYLQEMYGRIQGVYGDVYNEEWTRFGKRLTALFTETAKTNHIAEKWDGIMGYRAELQAPYHKEMTYRERFKEILNGFRTAMSQLKQSYGYILQLENEIDKTVPIRSVMEMELDEIFRIADTAIQNDDAIKKTCCAEVADLRSQFEHLFNDRYNKGLAMQHHAEFIDVCDCPKHTKEVMDDLSLNTNMIVEISQDAIIELGFMSWEQFGTVASNPNVIQAQKHLSEAYKNDKISIEDFNKILCKYLQQLERVIKSMGRSNWNVKGGPWDYYNTNIYNLHDDFFANRQPSFIGGGSFIEGREANEVCLYRECEDGSCIHRIRINNAGSPEEDKDFDTILAPVQNVFNGKNEQSIRNGVIKN